MTDGPKAALSTAIVFFLIVGIGPFIDWIKKNRSRKERSKKSTYLNYIISGNGIKDWNRREK